MIIPDEIDVLESVTDEHFRLKNWQKHRDDQRYPLGAYPFCEQYKAYDNKPFTRRHVFEHFAESTAKGVISAIKWGYPKGGRPGGAWHAFSDAFRSSRYVEIIEALRLTPTARASDVVMALNQVIPGIGTATTTKLAYFARLQTREGENSDDHECLIYDSMVRRAIADRNYPDFAELRALLAGSRRDISPAQQQATYGLYLQSAHNAARRYLVRPDQIELFLFRAGRILPPRK